MQRIFVILALFSLALLREVHAQNFIGMHKDEIIGMMKQSYNNFRLNKNVINQSYNYLKYEDSVTEQTILFFLSDNNRCTLVRWMSDYSNINDMIKMLDQKYSKTGKKSWSYKDEGNEYLVILEDGEWFFTVTFKIKN